MIDALADLYPAEAQETPAVLRLAAPRLAEPPPDVRNVGTVLDHYRENLLQEWTVHGGDRIALIDKAFPHSRYDVMLLASDDTIRSAVTDLGSATAEMLFDTAADFVDFLSAPAVVDHYRLADGHFHLCFNYDRDTVDRENSMFYDKRFHLHLNYTPGRDIKLGSAVKWSEIPDLRLRRRLIDPIAYLGAAVLHDATDGSVADTNLLPIDNARDLRLGLPPGAKVRLDGWGRLRGPRFPALLDDLHRQADRAYRTIHRAFTGVASAPEPWQRPALLAPERICANLDAIRWLSASTRAGLAQLAHLLRDTTAADLARYRGDEGARVQQLTVAGLDYAMSVFSPHRNTAARPLAVHDEVYLVMQFKLFGDIGGAGLPTIDGIPIVRLDRSSGPALTAAELADRRALRRDFLDRALPGLTHRHGLAPVLPRQLATQSR